MRLWVNGEQRDAPPGSTLFAFMEGLGLPTLRVAVERNGEIAPRSQWREMRLAEGDRLEIVHFVGGG